MTENDGIINVEICEVAINGVKGQCRSHRERNAVQRNKNDVWAEMS
jgi:hypothetical protein